MQLLINHSLDNLKELSKILGKPLSFIDLETTGMVHQRHFSIIEIGIVLIDENNIIEKSSLIDPKMKIPPYITEITGIDDSMVRGKKTFSHFAPYINKLAKNSILCGYNSKSFDSKGMEKMLTQHNMYNKFENQIDFRYVYLKSKKIQTGIYSQSGDLTSASKEYNIKLPGNAHRAAYDIALTAVLAEKILEKYNFGILKSDIDKFSCKEMKSKFYSHVVREKIQTFS